VGSWLALQVAALTFPGFNIPESAIRYVWIAVSLGFPIAIVFSWRYDIRDGGIVRALKSDTETDLSIGRVDFVILGALSIVVVVIAAGLFGELSRTTMSETAPRILGEANPSSIAVLPFVNMSEDPANEYFADGISEEILNLLAKIQELRVTARTSSFSFKEQDVDVSTIAARLNVAHILEGSVRKSGDQVRITAQLIETNTGFHLWSETFDRKFENIFSIQDEIAQAVIAGLKVRLLGEAPRTTMTSPEAYALYLKSRALREQFTTAGYVQAEAVALRALEIDNKYVPAWLALARIYEESSGRGIREPHEGFSKSRAAVMEALRLGADGALAHVQLSRIAGSYDFDLETARKELEIAQSLDPHDPEVLYQANWLARIDGEFAESIRLTKELEILDPISWGPKSSLGHSYFRMGRLAEAKTAFAKALDMNPLGNQAHFRLGSVMLISGDLDDALSHMDKATRDGFRLAGRAMVLHAMGDTSSAATELEKLIAIGDTWTYELAQVHAYFGDLDESFSWLHRAVDRRDQSLNLMTGDPFLVNLLDDPRYEVVLERLGRSVL
jgi:TolB-like protein